MHRRYVTVGQIAMLLIVLSLGLPIASEAEVFWTDDFENHLGPNWDTGACNIPPGGIGPIDGCNPGISTDTAYSGTHSLKSHYEYDCGMSPTAQGCGRFLNRTHPATDEVWMRWWTRFINGEFNPDTGSKQMYNKSNAAYLIVWMIFNNRVGSLSVNANHAGYVTDCAAQGGSGFPGGDTACNFFPNTGNLVPLNDGQWHCVETRVVANTPGVLNGTIEVWIDRLQTLSYTSVGLKNSGEGANKFTTITHYDQGGNGDRYIDDLAVGNTRIGCSGGTQAPAIPSGLVVR